MKRLLMGLSLSLLISINVSGHGFYHREHHDSCHNWQVYNKQQSNSSYSSKRGSLCDVKTRNHDACRENSHIHGQRKLKSHHCD